MFDGIVGHKRQLEALSRLVSSGRSHAILLVGPSGVGKRTIARAFMAHAVGDDKFSTHPDVMVVSGDRSIAIDRVRELSTFVSRKPQTAAVRIALIENAHRMAPLAADALLKTLEEPRGDRFIILTAMHTTLLPETVVSRMSVVSFNTLQDSQIAQWLARVYPSQSEDLRDRIVFNSCGSLGLADQFSKNEETLEKKISLSTLARSAMADSVQSKMRFAAKQFVGIKENSEKRRVAQETFFALEQALHMDIGSGKFGISAGRALSNARHDLDHNVAPQAVLENLLLSLK